MSSELVWEPQGVYWKYSGVVSGQEIIDSSTSVYGDPRFDNINYKLVDFLDIEDLTIDANELALIAYQHKAAEQSTPNVKNAIVIRSEASEIADKFAAFFEGSTWEVKVFSSLDDANKWIGRESNS